MPTVACTCTVRAGNWHWWKRRRKAIVRRVASLRQTNQSEANPSRGLTRLLQTDGSTSAIPTCCGATTLSKPKGGVELWVQLPRGRCLCLRETSVDCPSRISSPNSLSLVFIFAEISQGMGQLLETLQLPLPSLLPTQSAIPHLESRWYQGLEFAYPLLQSAESLLLGHFVRKAFRPRIPDPA
jgi:hypothetical protein